MSQPYLCNDDRVIDCPIFNEGEPFRWDAFPPGNAVRKIVLGQLGDDAKKTPLVIPALPPDFATRFEKLTHLYLWNCTGFTTLPPLPKDLQCLDVRGCGDLASIANLPEELETLVLENCDQLGGLPAVETPCGKLDDLSLKGCPLIPAAWVTAMLKAPPNLRRFDASDNPQLVRIPRWPVGLDRIDLNGCTGLEALPKAWPARLRRLGLWGASAVKRLDDLPESLDYLDLAHTESLMVLPEKHGRLRTLFLFGSGVRVPPASEHGGEAGENVAARTAAYLSDVALVGRGEVKRCKLLLLGNGGAGKTCLSLTLTPGRDPAEAQKLGSTHGVQFWDWDFSADVGGTMEPVHLHLWDFGGQEIYHNTHRLFMSKGAVFLVVWHPEQDGKQPTKAECGYQDEWRPLQYWLDFIHLACPQKPRIAIVCSHRAAKTAALERQWQDQVRPEHRAACRCFYVDSLHRLGELPALREWLEVEVGQVVHTQGVSVPIYWEIAQDMTERWVHRLDDPAFAAEHNQLHPHRFREGLATAMAEAICNDGSDRLAQLKAVLASGAFSMNEDRLRRTLEFLTRSGWLFWDEKLFEGRVIIGQKWALDGIYAVLDRSTDSRIYRALASRDGRFTRSELGEWIWDANYAAAEQELLLSFMVKCGLCFKLRRGSEAWREEDVYVSFEHLPTAKELRLQRTFDDRLTNLNLIQRTIAVPLMHRQHWQAFLTDAGSHYGKDANYALDGFYLENAEGEKVLVLSHFAPGGLGGEVEIQIGGRESEERLRTVESQVGRFLPGSEESAGAGPAQNLGQRAEKEEVFISYAWDPPVTPGDSGIPPGYAVPVDAIEAFLKDKPVTLIRDKNATTFGTNLKHFMEYGGSRPHVIIVHSDKFWRSAYCIFEVWTALDELKRRKNRDLLTVVIPVEHIASKITRVEGLEELLHYWKNFSGTPVLLGWQPDELRDHARSLLRSFSRDLHEHNQLNIRWAEGEAKAVAAIAVRLSLTTEPPASVQ